MTRMMYNRELGRFSTACLVMCEQRFITGEQKENINSIVLVQWYRTAILTICTSIHVLIWIIQPQSFGCFNKVNNCHYMNKKHSFKHMFIDIINQMNLWNKGPQLFSPQDGICSQVNSLSIKHQNIWIIILLRILQQKKVSILRKNRFFQWISFLACFTYFVYIIWITCFLSL